MFTQAYFVVFIVSFCFAQNNPADFKSELLGPISTCNDVARQWVRAAFHDAGTFANGKGGADGSLQFEVDRSENRGLSDTISFFTNFAKARGCTVADSIAFGGVLAVSQCGGPDIAFSPGRKDATTANDPGLLPSPFITGNDMIKMFVDRMGLTEEESVALIGGGHTIAKVHAGVTDGITPGPLDTTPDRFDNQFFIEITKSPVNPVSGTTRLPSDSIANHPTLGKIAVNFAQDSARFRTMFSVAFGKMINFGNNPVTPTSTPSSSAPAPSTTSTPTKPTAFPSTSSKSSSTTTSSSSSTMSSGSTTFSGSTKSSGPTTVLSSSTPSTTATPSSTQTYQPQQSNSPSSYECQGSHCSSNASGVQMITMITIAILSAVILFLR